MGPRRKAGLVLSVLAALAAVPAGAVPLAEFGSGTLITIRDCSGFAVDVACGSGSTAPDLVPRVEVGGLGQTVDEQSTFMSSSGAAQVEFTGQSATPGVILDAPVIRASAFSAAVAGDNTRVAVSTGGYQGYTYQGSSDATITIQATLDFTGLSSIPWGSGADSSTINAVIGAFLDDITLDDGLAGCPLFFCVGGTLIDFDQFVDSGSFDGSLVTQELDFDLDLVAGQSFFIGATLQVLGERGGSLDAFGTLRTTITGDVEVLEDLVPATRVPGPSALLLISVGLLGLFRRRRAGGAARSTYSV